MIQPSFDSTISEKEEFEQVGTQFQKLIDNALMLNQKGQYNDAIKLYQAAQDIGCNHFILFMGLADALKNVEQYDQSKIASGKALGELENIMNRYFDSSNDYVQEKIRLHQARAYYSLGDALYKLGDYVDAEKALREALHLRRNDAGLMENLAKILFKNDKYKDSFEMLQELQIDETRIELFSLKLKCLEKQEDLERALACVNNLIEKSEQTSLLLFVHASLLIKLGQLPEAIDSIFKSIELNQLSDPLLQVHKNQIFQLLGRSINENKIDIQQALNLIGSKPFSYLQRRLVKGISYIYELRQCIKKFRGLINLNKIDFAKKCIKKDCMNFLLYRQFVVKIIFLEITIKDLDEILEQSQIYEVLLLKSATLSQLRKYRKALVVVEQAIKLNTNDDQGHEMKSEILKLLRVQKKAYKRWLEHQNLQQQE